MYQCLLSDSFSLISPQDDFLVSKTVKQHLQKHDKQLKSFQVSKALDTALEVNKFSDYLFIVELSS